MADGCKTLSMIHIIGKKWTIPILELFSPTQQVMQFNSMQLMLNGITSKNLSRSLRELCAVEVLEKGKKMYDGVLHTEYRLTKNGEMVQRFVEEAKAMGICMYGIDASCIKKRCVNCPLFNAK